MTGVKAAALGYDGPPLELAFVKVSAASEAAMAASVSGSTSDAQCGWAIAMLAAMASATSRSSCEVWDRGWVDVCVTSCEEP